MSVHQNELLPPKNSSKMLYYFKNVDNLTFLCMWNSIMNLHECTVLYNSLRYTYTNNYVFLPLFSDKEKKVCGLREELFFII